VNTLWTRRRLANQPAVPATQIAVRSFWKSKVAQAISSFTRVCIEFIGIVKVVHARYGTCCIIARVIANDESNQRGKCLRFYEMPWLNSTLRQRAAAPGPPCIGIVTFQGHRKISPVSSADQMPIVALSPARERSQISS
jgi:hypothetical protein